MVNVKPGLGRKIFAALRFALGGVVLSLTLNVLFSPSSSIKLIGALCAAIGWLVISLSMSTIYSESLLALGIGIKQDVKLVEVQNYILQEIKKNNSQVIQLVVNQAELLSRMTSAAIKKNDK